MSQAANSINLPKHILCKTAIFPNHEYFFKRLRAKRAKASTTHRPAPHIHNSKSPPSVFP